MKNQKYQKDGLELTRLGLGCMRMSSNATGPESRAEGIKTIHAALDAGISLLNTADFYTSGHNEMLIGEALKGYDRDKAFITVKFGALVAPNGQFYGLDVTPRNIKNYLAYTLKRLNVDYIDLYQPGRIDLGIPVEETVGAMSELVKAGYVKNIGLSEVDAETLRRAHAVHPISFVETEHSLFNRRMEKELLPTAKELSVGIIAFGALAHGLLGGNWSKERNDLYNSIIPIFHKENIDKNLSLVEALREIAEEKQITLSQLAVAWVLNKDENIVPLIGAKRVTQIEDAIKALNVNLSEMDMRRIEEAIPENAIAGGDLLTGLRFRNGEIAR